MNELPKIVFSRTLEKVEWKNSRLVKENIAEEIARLIQQPGKDIALFGSAGLASTFIRLCLIDEYRILVTPVVLGAGAPMFKDNEDSGHYRAGAMLQLSSTATTVRGNNGTRVITDGPFMETKTFCFFA